MATRRPGRQSPGRRVLSVNPDAQRRRARRVIESESSEAWDQTKEARRDHGYSWADVTRYTDAIREARRRYDRGDRDFDIPERPEGLPPEAGYYHGKK